MPNIKNGPVTTLQLIIILIALVPVVVGGTLGVNAIVSDSAEVVILAAQDKFFPKDSGVVLEIEVKHIKGNIAEIKDNIKDISEKQRTIILTLQKIADKLDVDTTNP